MRLLIIGYQHPGQMGDYLGRAAQELGLDYQLLDMGAAETNNRFIQSFYWRFRGKRPAHLPGFAKDVLKICREKKPKFIITTGGRAPLERQHIQVIRGLGIKIANYSCDDPWNKSHYAKWCLASLPAYSAVFTPRAANYQDFKDCGVDNLFYMPFAYDPQIHRPSLTTDPKAPPSDVLFVGACDADRLPLIEGLIDAGLNMALFGGYWATHSKTLPFARGVAGQEAIRAASASAAITLCLVRRANRDGHVMRSYEAAAIGGCILAEDTPDHRALFGQDDEAVRYFRSDSELVDAARGLLNDVDARLRLAKGLHERMQSRSDTYKHRLSAMLEQLEAISPRAGLS